MARTRNTPKTDVVSETDEKLTAFDSHGARYFRMTLDRDAFAAWESDMNRWHVVVKSDGSFTATPVRDLVEVTPKVAKGATAAKAAA